MHKFFILICCIALVSCDAAEPSADSAKTIIVDDDNGNAKSLNDDAPGRLVTLFLEYQLPNSYTPAIDGRTIVAEPVYTVPGSMARGQGLVDGITVVYVGASCSELQSKYSSLYDCVEQETDVLQYGEAESSTTTNSDGFASMYLGDAGKYRLRVQSFVTVEDPKCYWGGERSINLGESDVSIPLLVFCE